MKKMNALVLAALLGMFSLAAPLAQAQAQQAAVAQDAMSEGEIKKVDKEAGKLTIKHGELKNLQMPGMTMNFRVADPAMLDKVKAGDKVRFKAEHMGAALAVTALEVVR
ncbi:copper-binding protein [Rugamonas sp. DEMB1]|uniref:Cu and Ag efflux protein CusF n=2 Tax=Rugamonas rubra TaxID=758825 RepID=A0A1I4NT01_9BURK|nr:MULTISPECIES: copper-binding protein [Rugamonas]WGG48574.1 copper-binding protein [Rugamonas sp. DEMB1]SFM18490.1 Cu and Ag efflux protein CusF [Rugamonas rubra]